MNFKQVYILYLNLHKKAGIQFFLKNPYANASLKFLCDTKLVTSLLIFLISCKNLKAVYLSFHWFDDSWTRGFKLATRKFGLVIHGFELVTRGFEVVTREFELVTRRLELVTREFEFVTHAFELVTRGF